MPDNTTTLIGNLTEDPDLRFTQSGVPVCTARIAVKEWRGKDNEPAVTFWNVTGWRDLGEQMGETWNKGERVIVIGVLKQRSYEDKEGRTVWVTEVEAQDVGKSQKFKPRDGSSRPESRPVPPKNAEDVPF